MTTPRFLLLLLLSPLAVAAQTEQTYHTNFASRPMYWDWIEEYHDQNVDREFVDGGVRYKKRTDNYNWSLYHVANVPGQPWSVSVVARIYSGNPTSGPGIVIMVPDYRYYFTLGAGGNYWVGRQSIKDNQWITLNTVKNNVYNPPSSLVKLNGMSNKLSISFDGSMYRLAINETVVEEMEGNDNWKPLDVRFTDVGIVACGITDAAFDSFTIKYVQPPIPYVKDAFVGAQKKWMKEFDMPNARYPVIAPNGKQLYYVASYEGTKDDAFYADATSDSTWTMGRSLGTPINNSEPNNVISVSQDGNQLFLYGQYTSTGGFQSHGYSTSHRTVNGWSVPATIASNEQKSTSPTREECLTADRSVMIASREIAGNTNGLKDLYVAFRQPDGSYGQLTNLGVNVNSSANEGMPYLAADGKTLYFGSGANGYGSDDIFVAKRLDDTWTNWSERVNMGPTINTPGWDGYFCIHPSGRWAYMNSHDGYKSGIVRVSLPSDAASRSLLPDPVMIVEGRVLNAKTGAPLSVDIVYTNLETSQQIGTVLSEPTKGEYSIVLNGGRKYGFNAVEKGYFPVSENIDLDTLNEYGVVKRDLYLVPIEQGSVIRLNNLFFDTDKWDLRPESTSELARLVDLLTTNPTMHIEISGHTDDRGTDAHNLTLSKNRANAVLAYLSEKGIQPTRLIAVGHGEKHPKQQGTSDEIRQLNRRVEFTIKSM